MNRIIDNKLLIFLEKTETQHLRFQRMRASFGCVMVLFQPCLLFYQLNYPENQGQDSNLQPTDLLIRLLSAYLDRLVKH
ncbi:hypothetical protein [Sphingobacterium cellulitidis]|uniref:hypothetical protein n=1 Tax=Sphingobacterium cellulitidis TaxID=1768011 RepID=UPI0011402042